MSDIGTEFDKWWKANKEKAPFNIFTEEVAFDYFESIYWSVKNG